MPSLRKLLLSTLRIQGICLPFLALCLCPARGRDIPPSHIPKPVVPKLDPSQFTELNLRAQASRIPVIFYPDVVSAEKGEADFSDVTPEDFEKEMQWLEAQGAVPIPLAVLHRHLALGEPVPEKAIVLAFHSSHQSFFETVYPVLKRLHIPATLFISPDVIGKRDETPSAMDWPTLKQLEQEGLVTLGFYRESSSDSLHEEDASTQEWELERAKISLVANLGHSVPYLAYTGKEMDSETLPLAKKAGFSLAFSAHTGPVEDSPHLLALKCYPPTKLKEAWAACTTVQEQAPAACVELPLQSGAVQVDVGEYAGTQLALVRGGMPKTLHSSGRQSVGEFVQQAGGVAGINGTFFANAQLKGADNTLIGPSRSSSDRDFQPEISPVRLALLRNRPMVLWNKEKIAFLPFQPESMNVETPYQKLLPGFTDAFLAGAWLVHEGKARSEEEMHFASTDAQDVRPRAFFGVTSAGEPVLGATITPVSSAHLGEAAVQAGVQEAVLLDSGYSTSLVYEGKILAVGHRTRVVPSRPVPHAIVLEGTPAPITNVNLRSVLASARSAQTTFFDPESPQRHRRHRRRRHRA